MSADDRDGAGRAVCAGCGCLCDDLSLDDPPYREGRAHVDTECELGREWFATRVFGRTLEARPPTVEGEAVELSRALARAAELLGAARWPLVTGLDGLSLAGQRKAVEVADRLGADLEADPAGDDPATLRAIHRDGGPFVTLGEIRERVDRLVLWFVRPGRTHPRLLERFYPDRGDRQRRLVAVGPDAGETGADVALPVDPEDAPRFLWLVRLLADDREAPEREDDPLAPRAVDFLDALEGASAGAWLYGGGASGHRPGAVETAGLLRFLHRLNERAPWGARPLRGEGNPAGAEAVTNWQTGFPPPVTFRDGRPRYDGGPPSRAAGDGAGVDAVLLAGGHPASLPIDPCPPCVWLDAGAPAGPDGDGDGREEGADAGGPGVAVRLPVLPPGTAAGDTLLRMDGLPVRSPGIPGAGDRRAPPADEVLDALLRELGSARGPEPEAGAAS